MSSLHGMLWWPSTHCLDAPPVGQGGFCCPTNLLCCLCDSKLSYLSWTPSLYSQMRLSDIGKIFIRRVKSRAEVAQRLGQCLGGKEGLCRPVLAPPWYTGGNSDCSVGMWRWYMYMCMEVWSGLRKAEYHLKCLNPFLLLLFRLPGKSLLQVPVCILLVEAKPKPVLHLRKHLYSVSSKLVFSSLFVVPGPCQPPFCCVLASSQSQFVQAKVRKFWG